MTHEQVRSISVRNEGKLCSLILRQLPAMSINWCSNIVRSLCFFTLFAASDVAADGRVTLQALTIYNTHEWFGLKPKVYFQCAGEGKVQLPDVKAKNQLYTFQGQESFQPLTSLVGIKCKRCGLYEQDSWNPDDVFGRWELCPLDFNPAPDGRYFRITEGEFNLTLSCPSCNKMEPKRNLSTLHGS